MNIIFAKDTEDEEMLLQPISSNYYNKIIDINTLTVQISDYYSVIKKYLVKKQKNFTFPSGYSEFIISESLLTKNDIISSGHSPFDILDKKNNVYDVKTVTCSNHMSNEVSLIQNFKKSGKNMDIIFKNRNKDECVKLISDWDLAVKEKLFNVKYNTSNFIYLIDYKNIGRFSETLNEPEKRAIYLSVISINNNYNRNIKYSKLTEKSIILDNILLKNE